MSEEKKHIKDAQDLLYLITCALHQKEPEDAIVREMDFSLVYAMAKRQSLGAMIGSVLKNKTAVLSETQIDDIAQAEALSIRRNMLMDMERAEILNWMENNKIWYMPLKGVFFKDMYPAFGMREMSDNDILFDPTSRKTLRDYMANKGYEVKLFETDKDDQYVKKPVYFFEMHVALAEDHLYPKMAEYYKNVKERLVPDEGKKYGYHFTDEDFYIFHVAHTEKHAEFAGVGLRHLTDSYVYLKQKKDMDFDYIRRELEKLGIADFEVRMRKLAMKLFDDTSYGIIDKLNAEEARELEGYIKAGTHGSAATRIENYINRVVADDREKAKKAYYMHRIFPEKAEMKRNYHVLLKHGWLLPFCYIHRLVRGAFFRRDKIRKELNAVKNI